MKDITVRPLRAADLAAVASVHRAAFPKSALTRLGPRLVARYYEWLLTGPHPDVTAVGAFQPDSEMVGFVFAGRFRRALSGFVHANRGRLTARVVTRPWLLGNELVRSRLRSAWRWVFRRNLPATSTPASHDGPTSLGVLAVAVVPSWQRRGVGQALLRAVEHAATQRGCSHLHLTVEHGNVEAIAFYERLGWQQEIEDGEWRGRMVKDVDYDGRPASTWS